LSFEFRVSSFEISVLLLGSFAAVPYVMSCATHVVRTPAERVIACDQTWGLRLRSAMPHFVQADRAKKSRVLETKN
jgi:hypothetical protein